jgi:ribosome-associated heat shock protein Hsp15
MRVDKFLWCIRVYKTRSLSSRAGREGRVEINELKCKPSKDIEPGDVIGIRRTGSHRLYKVCSLPKSRVGAALVSTYANEVTPQHELDRIEQVRLISLDQPHHLGRTGRPTKRDRRLWSKGRGDGERH